jgi:hypothetical protein
MISRSKTSKKRATAGTALAAVYCSCETIIGFVGQLYGALIQIKGGCTYSAKFYLLSLAARHQFSLLLPLMVDPLILGYRVDE